VPACRLDVPSQLLEIGRCLVDSTGEDVDEVAPLAIGGPIRAPQTFFNELMQQGRAVGGPLVRDRLGLHVAEFKAPNFGPGP
jgi:hypothetical protein